MEEGELSKSIYLYFVGVSVLVMVREEMLEPYDNLTRLRSLNCCGQIGLIEVVFPIHGK